MAKREQIPPLLECRSGVLTSFPVQVSVSRSTDDELLSVREPETPPSAVAVITLKTSTGLKASIGSITEPYLSGLAYIASSEERNSLSCRDISSCVGFVPIRDAPEMVVNLELRVAEAGLRRLGVAA